MLLELKVGIILEKGIIKLWQVQDSMNKSSILDMKVDKQL